MKNDADRMRLRSIVDEGGEGRDIGLDDALILGIRGLAMADGRGEPLDRLAALSGAASVAVTFVAISLLDHGDRGISPTQSPEAIGAEFARFVTEARWGSSLLLVAVALSLVFLGALWQRMQAASQPLAVAAVAAMMLATVFWLHTSFLAMGALVAGEVADGQTARTLLILSWESFRVLAAPSLVAAGAVAVAGLRYRLFPRAFVAFSALMAVLPAMALLPVGPAGLFGAGSGFVWLLVTSLVLAFGPSSAERPDAR